MQVWMGSTFGCAQCHSHKYDPITHKEYYQIFAIFNATEDNNSEAPVFEAAHVGRDGDRAALAARLAEAKLRLEEETKRVDAERDAWEQSVDRAALPKEIGEIVLPAANRKKEQTDKLAAHHRSLSTDWKSRRQADLAARENAFDQVATTTPVMKDVARAADLHVALRGEFQNKGDAVEPGVPAALHSAGGDEARPARSRAVDHRS